MTLTPHPYQMDGMFFLAGRERALLADDAGLGKSMQMIGAANALGASRIIVVCPAIGRVSWRLQFEIWDTTKRNLLLMPDDLQQIPVAGPCAVIVTFSWLATGTNRDKLRRRLARVARMDVAFVDEAHNLKSRTARRTTAVYGGGLDLSGGSILRGVPRVWVASATFTPLNAAELYPHMRALLPDTTRELFHGRVPNYNMFRDRFCITRNNGYGVEIVGNNPVAIPALRDALAPHILYRRKVDVLAQLPPVTTTLLPVEVGTAADVKAAREMFAADPDALDDDTFLGQLARAYDDPEHATKRRHLGTLKAKALLPWVADFLDNDRARKIVIFAHHRDTIGVLAEGLRSYNPRTITGETPHHLRPSFVSDFQDDPAVRVFIGQNRAANTSITLTAASTVLLVEPDPSPDQNYQAISRAHRIGQPGMVNALFAYTASNPIERRAAQVLQRRATDNAELFGVEATGFATTVNA